MKYILIFLSFYFFLSCKNAHKRPLTGKSVFQQQLNAEFKDASKSPLTKNDLKNFKGLAFFPIDSMYNVKAILTASKNKLNFEFKTTTNETVQYTKYGVVTFKLNDNNFALDIYQEASTRNSKFNTHLFLPFFDKTNGKTSYSGGRFIDLKVTDINNGIINIDFNKAYNPYCAYNKLYSCPIVPKNNFLDIEINAGVKAYKSNLKELD